MFTDLSLRTPYVQAFNLGLQRQVTSSLMVDAAYAGKIGIKLPALRTYNPARFINSPVDGSPPSDQNINDRVIFEPGILSPAGFLLGNDFRSWYHSFQVQATHASQKVLSVVPRRIRFRNPSTEFHFESGRYGGQSFQSARRAWTLGLGPSSRICGILALHSSASFHNGAAKALLGGWTLTEFILFRAVLR